MIRTEQWVLIMNELDTDTDTLKYLLTLIGPDCCFKFFVQSRISIGLFMIVRHRGCGANALAWDKADPSAFAQRWVIQRPRALETFERSTGAARKFENHCLRLISAAAVVFVCVCVCVSLQGYYRRRYRVSYDISFSCCSYSKYDISFSCCSYGAGGWVTDYDDGNWREVRVTDTSPYCTRYTYIITGYLT